MIIGISNAIPIAITHCIVKFRKDWMSGMNMTCSGVAYAIKKKTIGKKNLYVTKAPQ